MDADTALDVSRITFRSLLDFEATPSSSDVLSITLIALAPTLTSASKLFTFDTTLGSRANDAHVSAAASFTSGLPWSAVSFTKSENPPDLTTRLRHSPSRINDDAKTFAAFARSFAKDDSISELLPSPHAFIKVAKDGSCFAYAALNCLSTESTPTVFTVCVNKEWASCSSGDKVAVCIGDTVGGVSVEVDSAGVVSCACVSSPAGASPSTTSWSMGLSSATGADDSFVVSAVPVVSAVSVVSVVTGTSSTLTSDFLTFPSMSSAAATASFALSTNSLSADTTARPSESSEWSSIALNPLLLSRPVRPETDTARLHAAAHAERRALGVTISSGASRKPRIASYAFRVYPKSVAPLLRASLDISQNWCATCSRI